MKSTLILLIILWANALCQPPARLPVPVSSLRSIQSGNTIQSVRGTVTRTGPSLFVQDATGGVRITPVAPSLPLHIGDQVIVTGRVRETRYGSSLGEGTVRLLDARVPAPPLAITPVMASSGRFENIFVETEGVLMEERWTGVATQLVLKSDHQAFLADINGRADIRVKTVGSILRVRGVCLMSDTTNTEQFPFRILMRSPDDVDLIAGPPFWSPGHLALLTLLLFLLVLAINYVYLRLERWRFRLLLEDRTRTAHDLHDTLAQGFAGVAFQLQAVKNAMVEPAPGLRRHVDLAISMVSHSHEDARRAIAMLKPSDSFRGNLLEELQHQGLQLTQGGGVVFTVEEIGTALILEDDVRNALLRIGHEAISNALRHAAPKSILLQLRFELEQVVLTVTDDGCGFFMGEERPRGFGLTGMHARATSQGGAVVVLSQTGAGTVVSASIPQRRTRRRLQVPWRLRTWNKPMYAPGKKRQ